MKPPKKKGVKHKEDFKQQLAIFAEQSKARKRQAERVYEFQDGATKEAIEIIRDQIIHMSRGVVTLKQGTERRAFTLDPEVIADNALYAAVEIVKDLAIMDIRIASFKFDPTRCPDCGNEIKKLKKKRKAA